MKRLQLAFALAAVCSQLTILPPSAPAADITYPGAPLAVSPFGPPASLFPGSSLTGNTVTITGGSVPGEAYGGVTTGPAEVSGNTVTVTGSSAIGTLYGGRGGGSVNGNSVIFNSGVVDDGIVGGRSTGGDASGNSVTVNSGSIGSGVIGGESDGNGQTSFNTVTVNGGTINSGIIGGQSSGSGQAVSNTVTVTGGNLFGIDGGKSASGSAVNNYVQLSGGRFTLDVTGGRAGGAGHALNNMVQVYNVAGAREIIGGAATGSGAARGNTLEIFDGTVNGSVFGGRTISGNAVENRVIIRGGAVNLSVHGGYSASGSAIGNTAEMSGGTVGFHLYGGRIDSGGGSVSGNTVVMSGGKVVGSVYGAQHRGAGVSSGNTARISDGTVGANVYGGYSAGGPATGNAVEISDGGISGKTYGGFSNSAAAASGNRVSISGGRFGDDIHGGFSLNGSATGNTVGLSGTPNISAAAVYGGLSSGAGDVFSGNVFSVAGFRGPAKGILNFETFNFITPALGNGETQISITGGTPTGMNNTTVNLLGMEGGAPYLRPGDSIVLIDKVTGTPASADGERVLKGIALLYDFDISTADGTLRATLRRRELNPDSNILPEGRTAAAAFMNHYADLITGLAAERLPEPEERRAGPTAYAVSAGGKYRYTDESSTDVSGVSFITGLDWRLPAETGNTVLGVFFEGGFGDYNSRCGKGRFGTVKGDGDVNYYGAGVLGFTGLPGGLYAEASLRGGLVQTEFSSDYTQDALGRNTDYETSHAYYGAHAGLGVLRRMGERSMLDVYAKYLWLRQAEDDTDILGDKVHFQTIDSQRVRAGARFSYELDNGFSPYVGAAYEYEFDGKVRADVEGAVFTSSPLEGGTVVGELGGTYKHPGGLFLEAGIKGFEGAREGFAGRLHVGIEF